MRIIREGNGAQSQGHPPPSSGSLGRLNKPNAKIYFRRKVLQAETSSLQAAEHRIETKLTAEIHAPAPA